MGEINLVDPEEIEGIVGATRDDILHLGRLVTAKNTLYILHSYECLKKRQDLRTCPFSVSMGRGLKFASRWKVNEDVPVVLFIFNDLLVPLRRVEDES